MKEKKTSRFGIVDVGTNAVRFEIYEITPQSQSRIHQRREIFRLGETLRENNRINPSALEPLSAAFKEFQALCSSLGVLCIKAVGTSVFRQAQDAQEVVARLERQSGIALEIISGEREAELILSGVLRFEPNIPSDFLAIDVGGGSTEISLVENGQIQFSHSIAIGAITGQKQFLKSAPPPAAAIEALQVHIDGYLASLPSTFRTSQYATAICTSGTARALALLHPQPIPRQWIETFVETTKNKSLIEIQNIGGMKIERSDIIVAGAMILRQIIAPTSVSALRVSEYSLRHGLLVEALSEHQ